MNTSYLEESYALTRKRQLATSIIHHLIRQFGVRGGVMSRV